MLQDLKNIYRKRKSVIIIWKLHQNYKYIGKLYNSEKKYPFHTKENQFHKKLENFVDFFMFKIHIEKIEWKIFLGKISHNNN